MPVKSKDDYDVVIVGAGSAGLTAALTITRRSCLRVLVLEKRPAEGFGAKTCGDALRRGGLEVLHSLGVTPTHSPIQRVHVECGPTAVSYEMSDFVMIERPEVSRALRAQIGKTAEIRFDCRARDIHLDDGFAYLTVDGARSRTVRGRVVVDASGRSAVLRRALGLTEKTRNALAYREIVKQPAPWESDGLRFVYGGGLPAPGYTWCFPYPGQRRINIGAVRFTGTLRKQALVACLDTCKRRWHLQDAQIVDAGCDVVPVDHALPNGVHRNVIFVGDAAMHVSALNCEGHETAIKAGHFAGETIASHLSPGGTVDAAALWPYNQMVFRDFGFKSILERYLAARFEGVSEARFATLLSAGICDVNPGSDQMFQMLLAGELEWFTTVERKKRELGNLVASYPDSPRGIDAWQEKVRAVLEV